MAHTSSDSAGHVESLLQSSALYSENPNNVEMQQIDRRTRPHHGWVSKVTAFPLARPRFYLTTIGVLVALSILLLLRQYKEASVVRLHSEKVVTLAPSSPQNWTKPADVKIIALIFYGRPETVSILDCYMKQNLASNGGLLDEVHWAVNTDNPDSLKYLEELVKTSDGYKKIVLPRLGFESIWEHAVKKGNLYIKIDDDIVRQKPVGRF